MPNEKKGPLLKRIFISFQTKRKILVRIQNQELIADIGRHFNLNESIIRSIKQTEKILGIQLHPDHLFLQ